MVAPKTRTAGRPVGNDSTRNDILVKAREVFGQKGYSNASIRTIATAAGVDPSTVMHFFGTKDALFKAVVSDVAAATQPVIEALRRQVGGEELAMIYLAIWEEAAIGAAMKAIVRTSMGSEEAMGLLKITMTSKFLAALDWVPPLERELVIMTLMNIGIGRYLVKLPELARADVKTIARRMGPVLDMYLRASF